jgi:hypothetical protein
MSEQMTELEKLLAIRAQLECKLCGSRKIRPRRSVRANGELFAQDRRQGRQWALKMANAFAWRNASSTSPRWKRQGRSPSLRLW